MQVSNVSAPVMEVVLEFIYTNLMPALPEAFLSEEGAEELFYAADRYLIFPMKVCTFRPLTCNTIPAQYETSQRACVARVLVNGSEPVESKLVCRGELTSRAVRFRRSTGHARSFWHIAVEYWPPACICNRILQFS